MENSPSTWAIIPESDLDITAILPIGPIMPSNRDLAETLPFRVWEVPRGVRAAILKRTENRWAWFLEAEDLDEERGTQLGTLGYLPWEIRQMIFEKFFDCGFRQRSRPPSQNRRPRVFEPVDPLMAWQLDDYPRSTTLWMIRMASGSLRVEIENAFITMMNFDFGSIEAMMYFLSYLTTDKISLLRSITVPLTIGTEMDAARVLWLDVCAGLPSEHNSIEFDLYHDLMDFWSVCILENIGILPKLVDSLELLVQQIKRCWVRRANTSMEYEKDATWYGERTAPTFNLLASTFRDLEVWSRAWLEWWANSQEDG